MSTNNLFLIPAIFKYPNRETIDKNTTEQDILDTYLNITYPSLKKYADFYNYKLKFGKKLYLEEQDLTLRKKIWYSKWYNLKENILNYNDVILSDFDIIIKTFNDIRDINQIGVISKDNVTGKYKDSADFVSNLVQKKINKWYKSTFVYIPNTYKQYFVDEMNTTLEILATKKNSLTGNDETFLNYIIYKHDLPTFKVNKIIKMLHYGGDEEKRKLIQLNNEYFKFKKYFSYI